MKQEAFARRPADALFQLPCACQNLRRLTRIVTRIYDRELRKAGIEITQFGLLTALAIAGEANQKTFSAGFLACAGISRTPKGSPNQNQFGASRPELEYLKAVNSAAPPKDPQLLLLLMGAYANANQQAEGAEFLSARLNEFGPRLSDPQKALYLSAIGLLRAQHASSVSLLHRIVYVKDTIAMPD